MSAVEDVVVDQQPLEAIRQSLSVAEREVLHYQEKQEEFMSLSEPVAAEERWRLADEREPGSRWATVEGSAISWLGPHCNKDNQVIDREMAALHKARKPYWLSDTVARVFLGRRYQNVCGTKGKTSDIELNARVLLRADIKSLIKNASASTIRQYSSSGWGLRMKQALKGNFIISMTPHSSDSDQKFHITVKPHNGDQMHLYVKVTDGGGQTTNNKHTWWYSSKFLVLIGDVTSGASGATV